MSTAATIEENLPAILIDWDDTLCPTTWLKEDCEAAWGTPLTESMKPGPRRDVILGLMDHHVARLKEFLLQASKIGHIVIVTLGKKPWVEVSIQNWMPALAQTMRDCRVEVVYAQDFVSDEDAMQPDECDESVWISAKARAMETALLELQEAGQTWSSCISIGDSIYEIHGMLQAREALMKSGYDFADQYHTSTLKLLEEPTVEELTAELELLQTWLPFLVRRSADFHGEIESPDDDELQELHAQITGKKDPNLSWNNLVIDVSSDK
jgi:hypothetical protein